MSKDNIGQLDGAISINEDMQTEQGEVALTQGEGVFPNEICLNILAHCDETTLLRFSQASKYSQLLSLTSLIDKNDKESMDTIVCILDNNENLSEITKSVLLAADIDDERVKLLKLKHKQHLSIAEIVQLQGALDNPELIRIASELLLRYFLKNNQTAAAKEFIEGILARFLENPRQVQHIIGLNYAFEYPTEDELKRFAGQFDLGESYSNLAGSFNDHNSANNLEKLKLLFYLLPLLPATERSTRLVGLAIKVLHNNTLGKRYFSYADVNHFWTSINSNYISDLLLNSLFAYSGYTVTGGATRIDAGRFIVSDNAVYALRMMLPAMSIEQLNCCLQNVAVSLQSGVYSSLNEREKNTMMDFVNNLADKLANNIDENFFAQQLRRINDPKVNNLNLHIEFLGKIGPALSATQNQQMHKAIRKYLVDKASLPVSENRVEAFDKLAKPTESMTQRDFNKLMQAAKKSRQDDYYSGDQRVVRYLNHIVDELTPQQREQYFRYLVESDVEKEYFDGIKKLIPLVSAQAINNAAQRYVSNLENNSQEDHDEIAIVLAMHSRIATDLFQRLFPVCWRFVESAGSDGFNFNPPSWAKKPLGWESLVKWAKRTDCVTDSEFEKLMTLLPNGYRLAFKLFSNLAATLTADQKERLLRRLISLREQEGIPYAQHDFKITIHSLVEARGEVKLPEPCFELIAAKAFARDDYYSHDDYIGSQYLDLFKHYPQAFTDQQKKRLCSKLLGDMPKHTRSHYNQFSLFTTLVESMQSTCFDDNTFYQQMINSLSSPVAEVRVSAAAAFLHCLANLNQNQLQTIMPKIYRIYINNENGTYLTKLMQKHIELNIDARDQVAEQFVAAVVPANDEAITTESSSSLNLSDTYKLNYLKDYGLRISPQLQARLSANLTADNIATQNASFTLLIAMANNFDFAQKQAITNYLLANPQVFRKLGYYEQQRVFDLVINSYLQSNEPKDKNNAYSALCKLINQPKISSYDWVQEKLDRIPAKLRQTRAKTHLVLPYSGKRNAAEQAGEAEPARKRMRN